MTIKESEYEKYLRDIGGESRINRDLPEEDKYVYSKEYGTTSTQSGIEAQKAKDLAFEEYIGGMQASLATGQQEIDQYTTDATQTLEGYKNPSADAYKSWYSSQPMGEYSSISSPTQYRASGNTYQPSDILVARSGGGTFIPKSIGDPMVAPTPAPGNYYESGFMPYGTIASLGTGGPSDPIFSSWSTETRGLYDSAYQEYLTNLGKYQGELALAQNQVQGEVDLHKEALDAMRQRFEESTKRRTDNLSALRVGSNNQEGLQ
jgi:hypothetical protein